MFGFISDYGRQGNMSHQDMNMMSIPPLQCQDIFPLVFGLPQHDDDLSSVNPPYPYDQGWDDHVQYRSSTSPSSYSTASAGSLSPSSTSGFGSDSDLDDLPDDLDELMMGQRVNIGHLPPPSQPSSQEFDECDQHQGSQAGPVITTIQGNFTVQQQPVPAGLPGIKDEEPPPVAPAPTAQPSTNQARVGPIVIIKGQRGSKRGDHQEWWCPFNAPMSGNLHVPSGVITEATSCRLEVRLEPVGQQDNATIDPSDYHYMDTSFAQSLAYGPDVQQPRQAWSNRISVDSPLVFNAVMQPGEHDISFCTRTQLPVQRASRRDNDKLPSMLKVVSLYDNNTNQRIMQWSAVFHSGRRVEAEDAPRSPSSSTRSPKRGRNDDDSDDSSCDMKPGKRSKSSKRSRSK